MRRMRFAYLLVALCLSAGVSLQGFQSYSTKFYSHPIPAQAEEPAQDVVPGELAALQPDLPGPDRRLESSQANSDFGNAVSSAGDVNGDGYDDVVVGAWMYDNGETDEGAAFLYYGSPSGVQTPHAFMADGDKAEVYLGVSVAAAGDVNRDGYDDFLVGAPYYSVGTSTMEGRVYVYYGSASGVQEAQARILQGAPSEAIGAALAGRGDFNGDGFDDIAIGSYGWSTYFVRVYYGSPGGIGTTPSWSAVGSTAYFGRSVDVAGDVNRDGYDDLIVGSFGGTIYVYYGSPTGLDKNGTRPAGDTSNADWTASGASSNRYGEWVSRAGDVNADGYDEILVSQPGLSSPALSAAFLYYGSPTGLNANGSRPAGNTTNADWMLDCQDGRLGIGYASSAGDINADGFGDIFVGVGGHIETRQANHEYIFLGSANGLHKLQDVRLTDTALSEGFASSASLAGDVNADGYSDLIVGALKWNLTGAAYLFHGFAYHQADWVLDGTIPGAWLGNSVWTAGDVNHDHYSDIIAGAPAGTDSGNPGRAQIYHGSAGAPPRTPARTLTDNRANDQFGKSVSTAKDVNGDTFADVLIGAPDRSFGQFHEGAAYVYYGAPGGIITNTAWISESNVLYSQMGLKVASADVNGDARGDVIIGQYGTGTSPNFTGRVLVYYGSPGGISNPPSWIATDPDQYLELGMHVANAGDVNGDGYDDVMAQAYMYSDGSATVGAVLVWHGSETGLGHAGPYLYGADWIAVGNQAWGMFGLAGGKAGDVNSDGYDDLLVTAPWYDVTSGGTFTDAGAAFLYYGSAAGLGAAGTVGNADWAYYGDKTSAYMGWSASEMGDFNQDGYDDFVIGGGQYSDAFATEGKIWVFYGSPSGPGSAPNWTQKGFNKYAMFGEGVGPGGDINHDGYDDLLVGSPRHGFDESNGYPTNRGRVYVYFGRQSLSGLSAHNNGPSECGHPTTLTANLTQGTKLFYQWDFGDGSPLYTSPRDEAGAGDTILHTYEAAGIYTARVRAFDGIEQITAETTVQVFEDLTFTPGGTYTTTDQVLTFEIPPGLQAGVTITYTPQITAGHSLGDFDLAGLAFSMIAEDANGDPLVTLTPPIILTVTYDATRLPIGTDENTLELRRYDSGLGTWVPLTLVERDTNANTLTVLLDHFSDFALLVPEMEEVYLPLLKK